MQAGLDFDSCSLFTSRTKSNRFSLVCVSSRACVVLLLTANHPVDESIDGVHRAPHIVERGHVSGGHSKVRLDTSPLGWTRFEYMKLHRRGKVRILMGSNLR